MALAYGPNLLVNPSLESSPIVAPWEQYTNCAFNGFFQLNVGAPPLSHDGTKIAFMSTQDFFIVQCATLRQLVPVVAGVTYRVRGWFAHTFATATRNRTMTIQVSDAGDVPYSSVVIPDDPTWNSSTDWRLSEFTFVAPATPVYFLIQTDPGDNGSGSTTWRADDFWVQRVITPLGTPIFVRRDLPGGVLNA